MFENLEKIKSLAIVGATGLVGREVLELLDENHVRIPHIKLLASEKSVGESVDQGGTTLDVEALSENSFEDVEVALFSIPEDLSKKYAPLAVAAGAIVVDDSNAFRMDVEVPLVVPQVNPGALEGFEAGIISTPNCSTTPIAMCLKPLLEEYGLERVVVSTYQSVSGAGKKAYEELSHQTIALMSGQGYGTPEAFPHRIAFNCLPQIGSALENGNSTEEQKVISELRKILEAPDLGVSATAVRVPTFCGHGISVNVEFQENFESAEQLQQMFEAFPGLRVLDKPSANIYPTNHECVKSNLTFVGRIRRDESLPSAANFWVITDNLRKGAALNVIEILELLYSKR